MALKAVYGEDTFPPPTEASEAQSVAHERILRVIESVSHVMAPDPRAAVKEYLGQRLEYTGVDCSTTPPG